MEINTRDSGRHGLQHGKGTYVFSTGDRYEGEWQNGTDGEGIYFIPTAQFAVESGTVVY